MIPRPLSRLKVYVQREAIVQKLFTGHELSVSLRASVPTIESLAPFGGLPEVILIGRANVGKSTLINGVFKRRSLANVGKEAGGTQSLNFYHLRKKGDRPTPELILVDAPGYGDRGRPEWGKLFDHYIRNRKELRRIFIIINAEHGVTSHDKLMLESLEVASQSRNFTLQAILSKCDKVPQPLLPQVIAHRQRAISACAPSCLSAIAVAAGRRAKFGFEDVRHFILEACGHTHPIPLP